jgi:pimeloyl-ACP methyl ester carboxylesterase
MGSHSYLVRRVVALRYWLTAHVTRALLVVAAATGLAAGTVAITGGATASAHHVAATAAGAKPTIVLVHGAFADSSSWTVEAEALTARGYDVIVAADPLRSLPYDTAYIRSIVASVHGPVVLAGQSYAGMIISQVAATQSNVKALVYVAALIPDAGESTNALVGKFPGSELIPANLIVRPIPGGGDDLYIKPSSFESVYGNGLSPSELAAATLDQRPVTAAALGDKATAQAPAGVPKWEIVALQDHAVPTKLEMWMAKRAHAHVVTVPGGHDVQAGQPAAVTRTILAAARVAG